MLGYKEGQTVIVTTKGPKDGVDTHQVGVIVKKFRAQNKVLYDVLLESRSAISALNSSSNNQIYINRQLSKQICNPDDKYPRIVTTIPYAQLLEDEMLPRTRC